MPAQKVGALFRAACDLDLDRLVGKAEFPGDLLLGETVEFAEDEDFTAAVGQRINRVEQQRDFLGRADLLDDVGAFLYDARGRQIKTASAR